MRKMITRIDRIGDTAYLLMPAQQYAPADITPARHRHPLVQVLHQRVLCIERERLDHACDIRRFGRVQDREEGLEGDNLYGPGHGGGGIQLVNCEMKSTTTMMTRQREVDGNRESARDANQRPSHCLCSSTA